MLRVEGAILYIDPMETGTAACEVEITERDLEEILAAAAEQERRGIESAP